MFDILEKYVGITGDALQLFKSYFSDRSQSTRIESVMSDIVHIICGVLQGSVLGPLKFCIQLLPLRAILRYHGIGYHIYADDTQLYLSFKCDNSSIILSKLNNCISDIRVWMIKNKLRINDSKTEFIYIYVLFTITINGSAFKSIQTCKHNYVIYTMQINNNNKLQERQYNSLQQLNYR